MTQFFVGYVGDSNGGSEEENQKQMARWGTWLGALGEAVVNPGTPLMGTRVVSGTGVTDGAGLNRLTGYSVLEAESMEAALAMVADCPFLDMGRLEVAEIMGMGPQGQG